MYSLLLSAADSNDDPSVLLFSCVVILVGILLRDQLHRWRISLPYTVVMLIIGVLFGLFELGENNIFLISMKQLSQMHPHFILYIFLPALIFESSFNSHFHTVSTVLPAALILATLGVLISTGVIGILSAFMFNWSYSLSFLFGALLSATDPVAVVALLKTMGASEKMSSIIEAESLLNDGTAFILYELCLILTTHHVGSIGDEIFNYCRISLGGPAFGLAFGIVSVEILNRVFNDVEAEITSTVIGSYLCFYLAESQLHVSGILSLVVFGLYVNKYRNCISPDVQMSLQNVWVIISYIANTLIFALSGVLVVEKMVVEGGGITAVDFGWLLLLYVVIHLARAILVIVLIPLMKLSGYDMTLSEAIIVIFAGLRGK